ncbi:unnamed protein product, partial [Rotaria sp. Silwood2]
MLFALYNVEPVVPNDKKPTIETISLHSTTNKIRERIFQMPQLFFLKRDLTGSMGLLRHFSTDMVNIIIDELIKYQLLRQGPFITTTSRGIVHMKSYPSNDILNDPIKRSAVDRIFIDVKMDLQSYMTILSNSVIKEKHVLTMIGKQILMLPEHRLLYENLKQKYPERIHGSNDIDNISVANNQSLHSETTSSQSTNSQSNITVISGEALSHHNDEQTYNPLNQLLQQLHTNSQVEQSDNMSSANNITYISPTHVLFGILEFCEIAQKVNNKFCVDNSTNHQLSSISDTMNITNNQQTLPVKELTVSALNHNISSYTNEHQSILTQNNFTEQIFDNTMTDNNLTTTKQINNSIPNIKEKFSKSQITNILSSTFVMPHDQKQVALNIHAGHDYAPFIESESNTTSPSCILSNTLEISNSHVNDSNSYNMD